MKHKKLPRAHIVKGQPIFKQHLYISSALFIIIILITTFVLIQLAMDSLKDWRSTEISAISESYTQQIREQIQTVNARFGGFENESEFLRNTEIKNYIDDLLAYQEEILYVFIQDLSGEILWKSFKRGMELEQNNFSKLLFSRKNPRSDRVELTSLSNPQIRYYDLIVPIVLNDQTKLIIHLGLDNTLMDRRFTELQGNILKRILLASSVVVGILTLALFYVLWLLRRAQMVEAEAHVADQLAYLGTLASGLAHEIRNPLSAMKLNLQMIEEEIDSARSNGSELGTLLKGTKQEIRRLDRLATNFLFYARPLELEKERVSVSDMLDDVALLVSQECERAGIKLVREYKLGRLSIKADRDLLKQAILNLVVNAQDAVISKPMGDRTITLGATQEGKQVVITVRDSGPGIGSEEAKNLFKLLYSSKRGGTGLGLPIAQRIIEKHGGRIEGRNHGQGGAEFLIWLDS